MAEVALQKEIRNEYRTSNLPNNAMPEINLIMICSSAVVLICICSSAIILVEHYLDVSLFPPHSLRVRTFLVTTAVALLHTCS
jgi:hypothetical protein